MQNLPPSPGVTAISAIAPVIRTFPAGTQFARIWFKGTSYPAGPMQFRMFGPTGSRFDHHLRDATDAPCYGSRGILYAALAENDPDAFVAVAGEVFQTSRVIDLVASDPHFTLLRIAREIKLLDLTGFFAVQAGGSAAFSSGDRVVARGWSRDFYDAYPAIDGILYRSSMSGGQSLAVALYERCADAMPSSPELDRPLGDASLKAMVTAAAARLGYAITP